MWNTATACPLLTKEAGLDELCVRFIINLPKEELASVERICFQVEEAQWFYEDFIRPLDPELPTLNLRNFCLRIFQHCPLLSEFSSYHHTAAFSEFLAYKTRVPVRGAILLNHDMDQVLLVKGWKKSASWSFPRGKINKDEADLECAIREVHEETGFHLRDAGLVADEEKVKYLDMTMREQQLRLYIFPNVPMDAHFAPRTRKEISKIQWFKLSELPALKKQKQPQDQSEASDVAANRFYMVAPFMVPLKKWIAQQKKIGKSGKHQTPALANITDNLTLQKEPLSDSQPEQAMALATSLPNPDSISPMTVIPSLEKAVSLENSAAPLDTQPVLIARPTPYDDRKGGSSQERKEMLLSLFKKTPDVSQSVITSTSPSVTVIFPEKIQSNPASSLTISPLTAQSGISSINSAIGGKESLLSLFQKTPEAPQSNVTQTSPFITNLLPERSQPNPTSSLTIKPLTTEPGINSMTSAIYDKDRPLSLFKNLPGTSQSQITSSSPSITHSFLERLLQPNPASSLPISLLTAQSRNSSSVTFSGIGERSGPLGGANPLARPHPRTKAENKSVLLGYLDGVAKTDRVTQLC